MEIITEIKQKTKIIDTPTTITPTPEDEIRVPDLSYFEEETIIDYGPDDPFKLAMDNIQVPEPGSVYDTTFVGSDETHFLLDGNFKDFPFKFPFDLA